MGNVSIMFICILCFIFVIWSIVLDFAAVIKVNTKANTKQIGIAFIFYILIVSGAYPMVLSSYSWLCIQVSIQIWNLGSPLAKHMLSPLCYLSGFCRSPSCLFIQRWGSYLGQAREKRQKVQNQAGMSSSHLLKSSVHRSNLQELDTETAKPDCQQQAQRACPQVTGQGSYFSEGRR